MAAFLKKLPSSVSRTLQTARRGEYCSNLQMTKEAEVGRGCEAYPVGGTDPELTSPRGLKTA